jgi:hypothetical protein
VVEEAGEYPERTTDHGQATGKLYHLRNYVFLCQKNENEEMFKSSVMKLSIKTSTSMIMFCGNPSLGNVYFLILKMTLNTIASIP